MPTLGMGLPSSFLQLSHGDPLCPSPSGRQQMGVARLPDLGPPLYTHHQ